MIRVADFIAEFVYKQGVDRVFMLSGGGSIYLDDGLARHDGIQEICVRNETAAPVMAKAYAKMKGTIGVLYVTTGPGGANAIPGVVEAWVDSDPILVVSGQVRRNHTTRQIGIPGLRTFGVQELDIIGMVGTVTKYAVMIDDPESIRYHLEKATHLARTGRPGPVWIDVPLDIQSAMVDETRLQGFEPETEQTDEPNLEIKINQILDLLKGAKKPLVVGGHGIRLAGAVNAFRQLVERVNAPVILSRLGVDLLPASHPNNCGHGGIKGTVASGPVMKGSDVILSLGSRLSVPFVGEELDGFSENARIIMVDIEETELAKPGVNIDLPIRADAKSIISLLMARLKRENLPDYSVWLSTCREYLREHPLVTEAQKKNPIDLYYFFHQLDALSGSDDIFICDAGSCYYVAGQILSFEEERREVTSGAYASMGMSIPLAIGCASAAPNRRVLAVTGDGSLELNIQELKTMSWYNFNIKLFVINNGGYASIRATQDKLFDGLYIGSNQSADEVLNLRKVADAFDLPFFIIQDHAEIDDRIREILAHEGPAFVEVVCDNKQTIVSPLKTSS